MPPSLLYNKITLNCSLTLSNCPYFFPQCCHLTRRFKPRAGRCTGVTRSPFYCVSFYLTHGLPFPAPFNNHIPERWLHCSPVNQPQVTALMVSYANHCDTVAKHGRSDSTFSPVEGLHYAHRPPKGIWLQIKVEISLKGSWFTEITSGSGW